MLFRVSYFWSRLCWAISEIENTSIYAFSPYICIIFFHEIVLQFLEATPTTTTTTPTPTKITAKRHRRKRQWQAAETTTTTKQWMKMKRNRVEWEEMDREIVYKRVGACFEYTYSVCILANEWRVEEKKNKNNGKKRSGKSDNICANYSSIKAWLINNVQRPIYCIVYTIFNFAPYKTLKYKWTRKLNNWRCAQSTWKCFRERRWRWWLCVAGNEWPL